MTQCGLPNVSGGTAALGMRGTRQGEGRHKGPLHDVRVSLHGGIS